MVNFPAILQLFALSENVIFNQNHVIFHPTRCGRIEIWWKFRTRDTDNYMGDSAVLLDLGYVERQQPHAMEFHRAYRSIQTLVQKLIYMDLVKYSIYWSI